MALQRSLRKKITLTGTGLHSGSEVTLSLLPAPENSGIVFCRKDVEAGRGFVPARYDLVTDTRLGTTLTNEHGVSVSTVEHLMAALWGAGIDNAIVELDAPEVPIMDGSSEPFLELIEQAGTRAQPAARKVIRILKEVSINENGSQAAVRPNTDDYTTHLDVEIDFDHPLIARQKAEYDFGLTEFRHALASARTFGFAHEVEQLQKAGLALGGSLDNAIVVGEDGVLNEGGLRYPDEFIRHKALDCIGDLYLAGYRMEGAFSFYRPGHGINNALLHAVLSDRAAWELVSSEENTAFLLTATPKLEAMAAYHLTY